MAKIFQGLGPKRRESSNGDWVEGFQDIQQSQQYITNDKQRNNTQLNLYKTYNKQTKPKTMITTTTTATTATTATATATTTATATATTKTGDPGHLYTMLYKQQFIQYTYIYIHTY